MPQIKPDIETFAKIKVVGVGGSGGSAVNRMMDSRMRGVDFIALNTDVQDLLHSNAPQKLHIGKSVTRGLGAGMDPELGRKSAEESQNEIREIFKDADMVFIACGLGGGTGSGASPVVAEVARASGALTVAVVTKPFSFEGRRRNAIADEAWEELVKHVDAIITIPNDRINQVIDDETSFLSAFKLADDILKQGVQGISELITKHGTINVDFADVKKIMKDTGSALMGIGVGSGENRAAKAAKEAISSPLLELSIDGARGILLAISGSSSLTMNEVKEAAKIITASSSENAEIIFGATIDESMGEDIKITVIATGFDDRRSIQDNENEEELSRYSPFGAQSLTSKVKQREEEAEEKKFFNEVINRKKNYNEVESNSLPSRDNSLSEKSKINIPTTVIDTFSNKKKMPMSSSNEKNISSDDVSDDDLEIPAFIRRKMGA